MSLVDVRVPCACPDQVDDKGRVIRSAPIHPDGDTVSLPGELDVRIGSGAMAAIRQSPSSIPDMEGAIAAAFIHLAPRAWTLTDERGEPLALTADNIDARLTWTHGGMEVAERANELYAADLFRPLAGRTSRPSESGPTDDSTSPTPLYGPERAPSEKPSSRTGSAGRRSEARAS